MTILLDIRVTSCWRKLYSRLLCRSEAWEELPGPCYPLLEPYRMDLVDLLRFVFLDPIRTQHWTHIQINIRCTCARSDLHTWSQLLLAVTSSYQKNCFTTSWKEYQEVSGIVSLAFSIAYRGVRAIRRIGVGELGVRGHFLNARRTHRFL